MLTTTCHPKRHHTDTAVLREAASSSALWDDAHQRLSVTAQAQAKEWPSPVQQGPLGVTPTMELSPRRLHSGPCAASLQPGQVGGKPGRQQPSWNKHSGSQEKR